MATDDSKPVESPQQSEQSSGFYGNEDENTSGFLGQSVGRPLLNPMGRTGMWRRTLHDARTHPLLGIGPMNYVCTSPAYIGHPHNFPLQLAAEWGVPVALVVSAVTFLLLLKTLALLRRLASDDGYRGALGGLLFAGTLAAALHACVSGVMVMPASHVAGILVAGMLVGVTADGRGTLLSKRIAPYCLLAALAGVIGLLALGVHELRTLPERSAQLRPGEDMRPRIWQDAKVCRFYVDQNEVTN